MKFLSLFFLLAVITSASAFGAPCVVRGQFKNRGVEDGAYKMLTFKTLKALSADGCLEFASGILDKSRQKFAEKDVLLFYKDSKVALNGWSLQRFSQANRRSGASQEQPGCNLYRCHYQREYGYCEPEHPKGIPLEKCVSAFVNMKDSADSVGGSYLVPGYALRFNKWYRK